MVHPTDARMEVDQMTFLVDLKEWPLWAAVLLTFDFCQMQICVQMSVLKDLEGYLCKRIFLSRAKS